MASSIPRFGYYQRSFDATCKVAGGLSFLAIVVLGVLEQGAARMFVWPWYWVYVAFACCGGLALFALGVGNGFRSLRSLSFPWKLAYVLVASGLVASALASPFGREVWIWTLVPFALWVWSLLVVGVLSRGGFGLLASGMGVLGGSVSAVSMALWLRDQAVRLEAASSAGTVLPGTWFGWLGWWFTARNSQPLGHVNYTGGFALLFLPWLGWLALRGSASRYSDRGRRSAEAGQSWHDSLRRFERPVWLMTAMLCAMMLVSSGSRGVWIGAIAGLAVFFFAACRQWAGARRRLLWAGVLVLLLFLAFALVHPALRSSLKPKAAGELPNSSNAERRGMLSIGWRMGCDRPFTGWGIGAVPLAYDRYRGAEDYGPINMLQVHSTPLNLWAEGGILLVAGAGLFVFLAAARIARAYWRPGLSSESLLWPAGLSLAGYAVFSITDYQSDLPVIAFAVAVNLGVIAAEGTFVRGTPPYRGILRFLLIGCALVVVLGIIAVSVPWLRVRHALAFAGIDEAIRLQPQWTGLRVVRGLFAVEQARLTPDPVDRERLRLLAEADLRAAMATGAHGEIAQFSLGWLAVEDRANEARTHFAAVLKIAPSRAGVWLGLALVGLGVGDKEAAIDCLAMECLTNPEFALSGWWLDPRVAPLRERVLACLDGKLRQVESRHAVGTWPNPQARYYRSLLAWRRGRASVVELASVADALERRSFWVQVRDAELRAARVVRDADDLERVRSRVSGQLRRDGLRGPVDPRLVDGLIQPLQGASWIELIERSVFPEAGRAAPLVESFSFRIGFAVRQRNPYAQGVRDCMPQYHNPVAECLVGPALLPPGWLYDQELLSLVGVANRALSP